MNSALPTLRAAMRAEMAMEEQNDRYVDYVEGLRAQTVEQNQARRIEPLKDTGTNKLRPRTLAEVVGQQRLKPLLRRLIDNAKASQRPLSHVLLVGSGGMGKTTLASVIAHEIGTRVFALEAPLDMGVLAELARVVRPRDVIFVDEIHKQVSGDRRGLTQACDPESFYLLLEDGQLATTTGRIPFPPVTWIGATTDVGLLPISLSDRFPLQPQLDAYTVEEMATLARGNAAALGLTLAPGVDRLLAEASRGVPRQLNNYMRAANDLVPGGVLGRDTAREVVRELFGTTLDGLTRSMQTVLTFLYQHGRRETRDGVVYAASVNTLATACGHGRDTKAISLLVEPYLLQRGLIEVRPQGRTLTAIGVERAVQLLCL